MLNNHEAIATVAVRDMKAASEFYETVLGLRRIAAQGDEAFTYQTAAGKLLVYRSSFAGTNQATAVTWNIGPHLDSLVEWLGARGVRFEHYEMRDVQRVGDVHVTGPMRTAWFKDPDGNIHALVGGPSTGE